MKGRTSTFFLLPSYISAQATEGVDPSTVPFDAAPEASDLPPGLGLSVDAIEVPEGATDLTIRTG